MRSQGLIGSIIQVDAPVAGSLIAVAHEMPTIPRGVLVVRQSGTGILYRATTTTGLGLSTNFIAGWEFENGASLGDDSGSNGLTLTNNNVVTQVAGKVGQASSYVTASSQYLSRASEALLQTGDIDFTWAAWAYPSAINRKFIVGKDNNVAGQREYELLWDNTLGFRAGVFKATDVEVLVSTGGAFNTINSWYFVVYWHDATANTVNLQVNNGTIFSAATGGALQAASGAQFRIGARQFPTAIDYWNGQIDQVMFWKRTLTVDERTALYNNGSGVTVASALAPVVTVESPVWDTTYAYLTSSVGSTQYYVLFFI